MVRTVCAYTLLCLYMDSSRLFRERDTIDIDNKDIRREPETAHAH